jgi:chromosome segregation ATPase
MGAPTTSVAATSGTAATGQLGEAEVLGEELRSLRDLVSKKDVEIEALRKELRSIRRQLAQLDAQIESLRRKGTAPAK